MFKNYTIDSENLSVAEIKTSSTARSHIQAKRQPFFSKEGQDSFFSKSNEASEVFFSPSTVQPKLSIGQPNDKYEVEADAMADKVAQKLSLNKEPIQQFGYHGNTALQTKCATCEKEEDVKEIKEQISEIQQKPIFESDTEQLEAGAPVKPISTPIIQPKCETCEEEELQKKEEETSEAMEQVPELQEKPVFESNSEENLQPKAKLPIESSDKTTRALDTLTAMSHSVQPKCEECEKEEMEEGSEEQELQRKEVIAVGDPQEEEENIQPKSEASQTEVSPDLHSRLNSSKGGGSPLSRDTSSTMGSAFGADFSNVRVHTGSEAVNMSQEIGAQAFTNGNDIYFNEGKYDTNSASGKHLLAHELTHTVQQGASTVNPSIQKLSWDDVRQAGSNVFSTVESGANYVGDRVSDAVDYGLETASNAGTAISNTVESGIETVSELGESFIRSTLERIAPGLWNLLVNGIDAELKQRIFASISRLISGLKTRIENSNFAQKIRNFFAGSRAKLKEWQNDVAENCNGFYEKIEALVNFLGELVDPKIQEIRRDLELIGNIASNLWTSVAKPAWEAIKELAGDAWEWLKNTAQWIWDQTSTIRSTITEVWDWIKTQLGLLQNSASSIWDRFKEIASDLWNTIKPYIQPVLGPLKLLGGALLMLSPMGPVIAIHYGGPRIWNAIRWIGTNWSGWQTLMDFKDYFANEILPAISQGAQQAKIYLNQAVIWVNNIITSIRQAIRAFLDSIGVLQIIEEIQEFINDLRIVFNEIRDQFDSLMHSLQEEINSVLTLVKNLISALWSCVRPVLDFVLGLLVLIGNPGFWPIFIFSLVARGIWFVLPRSLKVIAIHFLMQFLRGSLDILMPSIGSDPVKEIFKAGALSFLDRLEEYSPDEKIRFIDKLLNFLIDPRTYGAMFRGLIGGFVHQLWTLISGTLSLAISIPGIFRGILNFFINLIPDVATVERLLDRITENANFLREILNKENLIQEIINTITNAPQTLANWIQETISSVTEFAKNTGRNLAEQMFNYVNILNHSDLGYAIGDLVGRILFEVLLTKGIGFVIGKIVQGVAWLRRFLTLLKAGATRRAAGLLKKVKELFSWIMQKLRTLFQRLSETLGQLFARFKRMIDDFIAWIMRAMRGGSRALRQAANNRAQWLAFITQVRLLSAPINRGYEGKTRREAASLFNGVRLIFNNIAGVPFGIGGLHRKLVVEEENSGYWKLMARKKFGLLSPLDRTVGTQVGRMPMKRILTGPASGRWGKGKRAVRERISVGFSHSQMNKRSLDNILEPLKERYHYRRLEVIWDSNENDWNVMASMSPEQSIARFNHHTNTKINHSANGSIIQKVDTTDEEIGEINQDCAQIKVPSFAQIYGRRHRHATLADLSLRRAVTERRRTEGYQNESDYQGNNIAGFKYRIYGDSSLQDVVREDEEVDRNQELHSEQRIVSRLNDIMDNEESQHVLFVDQIITERSPCGGCYPLIRGTTDNSRIRTHRANVWYITFYIRNGAAMARDLRNAYCDS